MAGRDRTCDAPRFRRALYRLSYGHIERRDRHGGRGSTRLAAKARPKTAHPSGKRSGRGRNGRGWSRTSGLLFVRQALIPSELLAREPPFAAATDMAGAVAQARCEARPKAAHPSGKRSGRGTNGRGWSRTSGLFLIREALCLPELPARRAPGQGLEPQSPRSERGVLPLRRSRIGAIEGARSGTPRVSVHLPLEEIDAVARPSPQARAALFSVTFGLKPNDVFQATRQPFDPGSPTSRCAWRRSPSYVEELWSPSLAHCSEKAQAKAHA